MSALTKILIVLSMLFSVVCAVLLVLLVARMEDSRATVASAESRAVGLNAQLVKAQADVAANNAKISDLQNQLSQEKARASKTEADSASRIAALDTERQATKNQLDAANAQLSVLTASASMLSSSIAAKDKELAALRTQVPTLTKDYNEIYRAKQELENQLQAAELAIKKQQELIADLQTKTGGASAGAMASNTDQVQTLSTVTPTNKVNGQVTKVEPSAGRMLIELPLGSRDGIQVGTKVYVYRASGYVGDATVQRVTPEQSVAVVMSTKPGETVQAGDFVSTVDH